MQSSKRSDEGKGYWQRPAKPSRGHVQERTSSSASRPTQAISATPFASFLRKGRTMYRDLALWSRIRKEVLRKGVSIRQVARETGIDPRTIGKMLDHPVPLPYRSRRHRYPKLGPHIGSIRRLLRENDTLPPPARLSTRAIYEHIRDTEGFHGGCNTVK